MLQSARTSRCAPIAPQAEAEDYGDEEQDEVESEDLLLLIVVGLGRRLRQVRQLAPQGAPCRAPTPARKA